MGIIEDEVRLRMEIEDLEDEVRDLEAQQRIDPNEETDHIDRPVTFRGWHSPLMGPILAGLALIGAYVYQHNLVGKTWDLIHHRFDALAHGWFVGLCVMFGLAVLLWLIIGWEHDYRSRVSQTTMSRRIGQLALALLLIGVYFSTTALGVTAKASPTKCPRNFVLAGGKCTDAKGIAMAVFGPQGWKPQEIKVAEDVPFNDHTEVRGSAAFSGKTLRSHKDIADFLAANKPARDRVLSALPKDEWSRALDGSGYVPVWFAVPAQWWGTTYHVGGEVLTENSARSVPAHDILWLFIRKDGIPVLGASIRADCGNPNFRAITPVRPNTPPAPPISQPPCTHNCQPTQQEVKCPNGGATTDRATPCVNLNWPQNQPLQDNDPALVQPSSGCTGNDCMHNIEQQQQAPDDGGSRPGGIDSGGGGGSSPSGSGPSGSGSSQGTSNPDNSTGEQNQPTNTGDGGGF